MRLQGDRLAVSALVALAVFFVGLVLVAAAVALFTGGWYVTVGVVAFFALWAAIYRITEAQR